MSFTLIVHPDHPWTWEEAALRNCPDVAEKLGAVRRRIDKHTQSHAALCLFMGEPAPGFLLDGVPSLVHQMQEHPSSVARRIVSEHGAPTHICGYWRDRCVKDIAKFFPAAIVIPSLSPKYPF